MININEIPENVFSCDRTVFGYKHQLEDFLEDEDLLEVGDVFYAGIYEPLVPSQFFNINNLLEDMQDILEESGFSISDRELSDGVDYQTEELLSEKIGELLDKYLPPIEACYAKDIVRYEIVEIIEYDNSPETDIYVKKTSFD